MGAPRPRRRADLQGLCMTRSPQVTKVPWILGLGFRVDYIKVIMENQMEKKMENEMAPNEYMGRDY